MRHNTIDFDISPLFCVYLCLIILVLPIQWVISFFLAAIIHEMFHYAAVKGFGGMIHCVKIRQMGVEMKVSTLSHRGEMISALAGPLSGLLLLLFINHIPRIAICAAVQTCFNLLPVYPMDGGRILRCVLSMITSLESADRICWTVEWLVGLMILLFSIYGSFILQLGIFPLVLSASMLIGLKRRKTP